MSLSLGVFMGGAARREDCRPAYRPHGIALE